MTRAIASQPLPSLARLRRRLGRPPWAMVLEAAARIGYMARGAVYLSVGGIALLAATGMTPHAEGSLGALEAWGDWPAGLLLLWTLGLGLYAFAGWRLLQAVLDVDRCGRTAQGLFTRAGQALSGLTYGALAVSVFGLVDAMRDLHQPDDQDATRAFVSSVLALPFGPTLILAMGIFVLCVGAGNVGRAAFDHFARRLDCDRSTGAWAGALARVGYLGRGVAILPAGLLLAGAGWHARASEAGGLGDALDLLGARPFGGLILGLTALGLIAFGLFALVEGWLRPVRLDRAAV